MTESFTVSITNAYEDTDGDGFSDQQEITAGTLLNDPNSKPGLEFGLLGYWPLDGNSSDMSGNGRDGTRHNGAAFQTGAVGQGLYFDGNNDSFTLPGFPLGGEMTISFWGKINQFQDWDTMMDFANGSNSHNLKIQMDNSGASVREMIFQMKTPNGDRYLGDPFWVLNKWVHLVLTVDKDATISLYRSGIFTGAVTGTAFADTISRSRHWFGKSAYSANYTKGMIDEIRFYDRAILADEALQLALQGNTTPYNLNSTAPLNLSEGQAIGSDVGHFTAVEPDAWDSVSYELFDNNGSTDNSFFTIESNGTLKTATTFDFENNKSTYTIQVLAKDDKNATTSDYFTVNLVDVIEVVETFTVSGGQGSSPYYTFTDSNGNTPDFSSLLLNKGSAYEFVASGVSGSHPFMIGESYGDTSSPHVSGGPLNSSNNGSKITLSIPRNFSGNFYYFCQAHSGMVQQFQLNPNQAPTGAVSISGSLRVGDTLSVSNSLADENGLGAMSYQWLRDGNPIILGGTLKDGVNGVDGLDGASMMAVSSDNKHMYVIASEDNSVSWFQKNSLNGELTYGGTLKDGINGTDGLYGTYDIAVSNDGKHVYITSKSMHEISWFDRNVTSGALSYVGKLRDGVAGVDGLYNARSISLSPDGLHVYVAGSSDDEISMFERNSTSGALTYIDIVKDGVNGVDGLDGVIGTVMSSDGKHLYSVSAADDAISCFERNSTDGNLTFISFYKDGVNGVDGLNQARTVAITPDGLHIYVTAISDNAVSWFERNSTTGDLTYGGRIKNGQNGITALSGPIDVKSSPDGKHIYISGPSDDTVTTYQRDLSTGSLTPLNFVKDGLNGVEELDGATRITFSADGSIAYIVGPVDDAINWFTRNSDTGALHYGQASGTSYKTTAADSGSNLSVQASYTDGGGNSEQVSSIATPSILPQVLTDDNFHFAIDQWFINETYATAAYGHISDWNTSAVTDMSKALKGRTEFNEDIGIGIHQMSQICLICL